MEEHVDIHVGGYHLTEPLGTGGMGSVFKATVEADDKPAAKGSTVAVKLLHPHLRSIGEFVKRFHREARLAAQLDHPNIVRVLDEGEEDRKHYIVMEYAEGMKLNDLMDDGVPLSPQQTIEIMNQVCEALKAASHVEDDAEPGRVRSIVHRDVKPDNIIIQPLDPQQYATMTQTGDKTALANIRVKLLDFGLAKDVKALSTVLSQTGQSLGTPAYMSPEQCRGGKVDSRTDIYSLGVVAYHMITGTTPFAGPTTVAFAQQHADEIPPDILKRNPLCPKSLADCIYRCMAKTPKDRYSDCVELQSDLARVAAGQSVAKVYKFKKAHAVSKKKIGAIAGVCTVSLLAILIGLWLFWTDSVKADLDEAMRKADVAIASGNFAGAKDILTSAIDAVPPRPDRETLIKPASEKLRDIASRAAAQEKERLEAQRLATIRKHQQAAISALADIKAKIARQEWQQAIAATRNAIGKYSDTPSAAKFPDLLATAEAGLKAEQDAEKLRLAAEEKRRADEAKAAHARFVKYRDEGLAAMKAKDHHAAIRAFDSALAEKTDSDVQRYRQSCIDKVTKHRIAVVDFKVKGRVNIADAGETVPELLLPEFGQERYQLVERSQLAAILAEHDLTIAKIVNNPALLRGKKLKGLRYLVLGSVVKLGSLAISARMVDVRTGDMLQTAKVTADDASGLQAALGELAKILQMTPKEKKAYLDDKQYPALLAEARKLSAAKQFTRAITTYNRVLAIRSTITVRDELRQVRSDKTAWENMQAEQRKRELARQAETRRKEAAFASLMSKARGILSLMPSDKKRLSALQKTDLSKALQSVHAALAYKPANRQALALKASLNKLLEGGKYITLNLARGITMKLVRIPAGTFTMGSPASEKGRDRDEGPQRRVTITSSFYMGVYEITQEQYQAITGKTPSKFKGAKNPVEKVSWNDAVAFCEALSKKTGKTVRLPTEAEWEYACRAGTTTAYSWGNVWKKGVCNAENDVGSSENSNVAEFRRRGLPVDSTVPVGSFKPNAFGLYDMHGNVWEWCSDWYKKTYANADTRNPQGANSGSYRVLRGGSWNLAPGYCQSANRVRSSPDTRDYFSGFRVVVVSSLDMQARQGEIRRKEAAFASLMFKARKVLASMPSDKRRLSALQKSDLRKALQSVQAALAYKPADAAALALKASINKLLEGERKYLTLNLSRGVTMKLVRIPSGTFTMGSPASEKSRDSNEGPQHRVTITKPFYMGVHEVTQEQYQTIMGKNPSRFKGAKNPVEQVSWNDAVAFCKALSKKTGKTLRLPTEAQWEYACRAGTTTPFNTGSTISTDHANYNGDYTYGNERKGIDRNKTISVGSFKPNAWGLYDTHGNVYEWCSDWYKDSYAKADVRDPQGTNSGSRRVVRGGSWRSTPRHCRSANRGDSNPNNRSDSSGFRVVVASSLEMQARQAEIRRKEAAFANLMSKARGILSLMPSDKKRLTASQKSNLRKALQSVQAALAYKPIDRQALALKARINKLLEGGKFITLDLGSGVTMKLVRIPSGTFTMGSPANEAKRSSDEGPQRRVTITKPFYMGVTEITQAQWHALMSTKPWKGQKYARDRKDHAASYITWNNAVLFCKKLSAKTGKTIRLPTEAEWEYACRAGNSTCFNYGEDIGYRELATYSWYHGNAERIGENYAHLVGQKKPNAWKLHDMHGNVWEWCSDWYSNSYSNAKKVDPLGSRRGSEHVLRGGSWNNNPWFCRSACRYRTGRLSSLALSGFRVAVASSGQQKSNLSP